MTTVRTITTKYDDRLSYDEPNVLDRLRHMAEDAVNHVNDDAVAEEVAILRARLGLDRTDRIPAPKREDDAA